MERPKIISKRIASDLPTNEELGKITIEQRIELGKKHVKERRLFEKANLKIEVQLEQRKDLSPKAKGKLSQRLLKEEKSKIHKEIFEKE